MRYFLRFITYTAFFWALVLWQGLAFGVPTKLGDLDEDGQATVLDVVILQNHLQGSSFLSPSLLPFADVNKDGVVNAVDATVLADIVLQRLPLEDPQFSDRDFDGLPNDFETAIGLDPDLEDSNGNSVVDGLEDSDIDGLPNIGEFLLGTDPTKPDSDGNGTNDGLEDSDFDGINDGDEIRGGTDPTLIDTDGDGLDDLTEIAEGRDPTISDNMISVQVTSTISAYLNALPTALPSDFSTTSVQSLPIFYLNAQETTLLADHFISVQSFPMYYINTLEGILPTAVDYPVESPLISYESNPP